MIQLYDVIYSWIVSVAITVIVIFFKYSNIEIPIIINLGVLAIYLVTLWGSFLYMKNK